MTYYDILEIKPEATPEIVQAAYKAQKKNTTLIVQIHVILNR